MAEGTSKVVCNYLLGNAGNGVASRSTNNEQPSNVCKYYVEGHCRHGAACRYDHDKSYKRCMNNRQAASSATANNKCPLQPTNFKPFPWMDIPPNHFTTLSACSSSHQTSATTATSILNRNTSTTTSTTSNLKISPTDTSTFATTSGGGSAGVRSTMPLDWALAPEFKPRNFHAVTYSAALQNKSESIARAVPEESSELILCDFCSLYYDRSNLNHLQECKRASEEGRVRKAVIEVSSQQTCGICLDVVWQKQPMSSQRFGLLSGCNHVFCLECIRKWRGNKCANEAALRSCPECRTRTAFVVPSYHWFLDQDDKERIINDYKTALKCKACKYFKESHTCPFGDSCFYSHKDKNGKEVLNVKKKRRYVVDEEGQASVILSHLLSEFIQIEEALRDFVGDDDDSDDSDAYLGLFDEDDSDDGWMMEYSGVW